MLFDSPNEVLKSEPLSEFQKDFIKTQLNNSRYSKLEYNKTEISPKVYKKKLKRQAEKSFILLTLIELLKRNLTIPIKKIANQFQMN